MLELSNGVPPLPAPPTVEVKGLSYLFPGGVPGLDNVVLDLPAGSRTLLIGGSSSHSSNLHHGKLLIRLSKRSGQDNASPSIIWEATGTYRHHLNRRR